MGSIGARHRTGTIPQPAHKRHIAFQEIVLWQPVALYPCDLRKVEVRGLAREFGDLKKYKARHVARAVAEVVALDFIADPRVDAQFFAQLARQRFARFFAGFDFAARKLPLEPVSSARLSLSDKNQAGALNHRRHYVHNHARLCIHLAIIGTRMHSERLLDHFQNPRNPGELPPPAVLVNVTNPACGDMLRLSASFENGRVEEARFLTRGCTAAIAASSALTEWMTGKSYTELAALTPALIETAVGGLEPASKHAAVLCVDAVRQLLAVSRQN